MIFCELSSHCAIVKCFDVLHLQFKWVLFTKKSEQTIVLLRQHQCCCFYGSIDLRAIPAVDQKFLFQHGPEIESSTQSHARGSGFFKAVKNSTSWRFLYCRVWSSRDEEKLIVIRSARPSSLSQKTRTSRLWERRNLKKLCNWNLEFLLASTSGTRNSRPENNLQ